MIQTRRKRLTLLCLVLSSFAFFAAAVILRTGIANTPDETMDSAGRTMGLNDSFSKEHYLIALRNFRIGTLFKNDWDFIHLWPLLVMHIIGAILLSSPSRYGAKGTRYFFFAQPILFLFPFGWLGFFLVPLLLFGIYNLDMDREGFIDIPFISCMANPVWISASLIIYLGLRHDSLSLIALAQGLQRRSLRVFQLLLARMR